MSFESGFCFQTLFALGGAGLAAHCPLLFLGDDAVLLDDRLHLLRGERNERGRNFVFGRDLVTLIARQQRHFGNAVEQMDVAGIEREFDHFAAVDDAARIDLGDHVGRIADDRRDLFAFHEVEFAVDLRFGAEFFDDFDERFHDCVGRSGDEVFFIMDIFGADAENDGFARIGIIFDIADARFDRFRKKNLVLDEFDIRFALLLRDRCGEEVHLRRSDKAGDELVDRIVVQVLRRIDLLHEAVFHNDDTGTHRHGLDLVVRDVDERGRKAGVQFGDLRPHLGAQLRVEVRQRFVEQEHFRFADDGAAERDTLALTAGKSLRLTGEVIGDAEDGSRLFHAFVDDLFGNFAQFQTERHVVVHGHVRVQSVVLEHHRDVAVFRNDVVDEFAVDVQFALRDLFQARDHAERRRLTAAGRAYKDDEFFVFDLEVEVRNGGYARRINLVNTFEQKACHRFESSLNQNGFNFLL